MSTGAEAVCPQIKRAAGGGSGRSYDFTEGTMRPKKWLPRNRRAEFSSGSGPDGSSLQVGGSDAINSEPMSVLDNCFAGAIERWVHSRRYESTGSAAASKTV